MDLYYASDKCNYQTEAQKVKNIKVNAMMSTRIGSLLSALAGSLLVLLWASSAHEAYQSYEEFCPACYGEELALFEQFDNLELKDVKPALERYRDTNPKMGNMRVSDILEYENTLCDLEKKVSFVQSVNLCCTAKPDSSLYDPDISSLDLDVSSTDFDTDELGLDELLLNRGIESYLNDQLSKRRQSCAEMVHSLLETALSKLKSGDRKLLEQFDARRELTFDHIPKVVKQRLEMSAKKGNTFKLVTACSKLKKVMDELGSTIDLDFLLETQGFDELIMEWWNIKRLCEYIRVRRMNNLKLK